MRMQACRMFVACNKAMYKGFDKAAAREARHAAREDAAFSDAGALVIDCSREDEVALVHRGESKRRSAGVFTTYS